MKKLSVILEKTNTGYSVFSPDFDGCISTGDNLSEAKTNFIEALELFIETSIEFEEEIPEILKGKYELSFKIDVKTFFEWIKGIMTQTGIAQIAGMNKNLISQYANGIKEPSQKQLLRIEQAFHKFGSELQSLNFSM